MTKYRHSDKLHREQRAEIAYLLNAGVPRRNLAALYGVSVATVAVINRQRKKRLSEDIAQTPESKFLYAQRLYGNESLSDIGRNALEENVFRPLAIQVASKSPPDEPSWRLLCSIFGEEREARKAYREAYHQRCLDYGFALLRYGARRGVIYPTREDAQKGLASIIDELEAVSLRPEERQHRDGLQARITEVLGTLTYREREAIKLRHGFCDRDTHTSTLEDVARIFQVTRERVRQIEAKAIRKLRHPVRARQLASYAELEDQFPPETPYTEPRDIPLRDFEFSVRARNVLSRARITTLGDLANHTEASLLVYRHFGETSLEELREHLRRHGLDFKKE